MADHLDAPGLQSPEMNARIDITDIYAFQKPGDASKSILVMNVNPLAPTLAHEFDHQAVYELKIDTDGDAVAEIAFRFTFSPVIKGGQVAAVHRATGRAAAGASHGGEPLFVKVPVSFGSTPYVATSGQYKFFAGLRSDPFFFDLLGFLNGFNFTGQDFFIDKNVFGIVLEVPNAEGLGQNPKIGVWGRTVMPRSTANNSPAGTGTPGPTGTPGRGATSDDDEEELFQVDRMGRPAINTVFNHGNDKNIFNHIPPTEDRTAHTEEGPTFLQSFEATLESFGYSPAAAENIAKILLPDILTYDYSSAAGFLNGRKLTDDVIDIELALVTNGKVTTDKVGPHRDLLNVFPYLGTPHPV
jgi:hypothetical protein